MKRHLRVLAFILAVFGPASALAETPIGILLAAGDISTCGGKAWHSYANQTAALIRKVIADAKKSQPPIPVRVLALGDLAYAKGSKEEFDCFAQRWNGFDEVLLPIPGNHEYLSSGAAPYFNHFKNNPFVSQNGPDKGYFALSFPNQDGPWRLIGLNVHIQGRDELKKEIEWLEMQLADNGQRCVLAFLHAPTFTSGRHGHDYKKEADAPLTKNRPMHSVLRLLYNHGGSVVLAGHDHNYEQFRPHDADGNAKPDGLRSFVVGTGGSLLTEDSYKKLAPNSEGLYGRTKGIQGILKISLFADRYTWEFLPIDAKKTLPLQTKAAGCNQRKKPS